MIDRPSSVLATVTGPLTSPRIKVKFSCGADRADKRDFNLEVRLVDRTCF